MKLEVQQSLTVFILAKKLIAPNKTAAVMEVNPVQNCDSLSSRESNIPRNTRLYYYFCVTLTKQNFHAAVLIKQIWNELICIIKYENITS